MRRRRVARSFARYAIRPRYNAAQWLLYWTVYSAVIVTGQLIVLTVKLCYHSPRLANFWFNRYHRVNRKWKP